MLWIRRPSRLIIVAIALTLGLVIPIAVQAQPRPAVSSSIPTSWNFDPPPKTGIPENTEGGGVRGPCVREPNEELKLTALVRYGTVGSTVAAYPSFSWYVPRSDAEKVMFVLKDADKNPVYETEFAINGTPGGIASLRIPAAASVAPLEIGEEYEWELSVICNQEDSSGNMTVSGWIKRVELSPVLASRLQGATPEERVSLYAANQQWYDTVNALVELRRLRPSDNRIADAWKKLLASVELNAIAQQPMFESSTQALESPLNTRPSNLQLR